MASLKAHLTCPSCQTVIAPDLLVCPGCHALVHRDELKQMAQEAERLTQEGKLAEALLIWRKSLELLPSEIQQAHIIREKIAGLSQRVDSRELSKAQAAKEKIPQGFLALGTVGVLLWKFKFLLIMLVTKGKLLLAGLTNAPTFFSMLLAFGVYWSVWGWKFALGILLSIYIHEMGHVFALKKLGIPVSAPIFIPGVGAFIHLKSGQVTPTEDARIGLAGPIAGLLAAIGAAVVFGTTGSPIWGAIAKFGAWVNLFNLLPFSPLDGGRGFHPLSQKQKWIAVGVIAAMWFWTHEGLLFLLLLVGVFNAFQKVHHSYADRRALIEYCFLVVILSLLAKYIVVFPEVN